MLDISRLQRLQYSGASWLSLQVPFAAPRLGGFSKSAQDENLISSQSEEGPPTPERSSKPSIAKAVALTRQRAARRSLAETFAGRAGQPCPRLKCSVLRVQTSAPTSLGSRGLIAHTNAHNPW